MKNLLTLISLVLLLTWGSAGFAGTAHQEQSDSSSSGTMEHSKAGDTFTHQETVQGISTEFQVMSLAAMNMKDPKGKSHHIMAKFFEASSQKQINDAIGKIKVISPSGREQVESLQNYSGILAANFTFKEKGKYGVICLFKVDGKKRLVKFWYPHE